MGDISHSLGVYRCIGENVSFAHIFRSRGRIEKGPMLAVAPVLRAHAHVGLILIVQLGAGHGQKLSKNPHLRNDSSHFLDFPRLCYTITLARDLDSDQTLCECTHKVELLSGYYILWRGFRLLQEHEV